MTCCFPSIGVEKVKIILFPPSFRFNDASCSEVGVVDLRICFTILGSLALLAPSVQLPVFVEFSASDICFSLAAGCSSLFELNLFKEKGQRLQLPLDETIGCDVFPIRDFSTQSKIISYHVLRFKSFLIPNAKHTGALEQQIP